MCQNLRPKLDQGTLNNNAVEKPRRGLQGTNTVMLEPEIIVQVYC